MLVYLHKSVNGAVFPTVRVALVVGKPLTAYSLLAVFVIIIVLEHLYCNPAAANLCPYPKFLPVCQAWNLFLPGITGHVKTVTMLNAEPSW